ncbi:thioredoxin H-type-like [Pollicipes pollicipes]|uniref:thioredoxin H-type-like n=1 Tax=Pollicipes pollicipes TaxID=41117 RepID=UPI0018859951|nr:thioredoxin H-type-like [Pollicipes pollicipes]
MAEARDGQGAHGRVFLKVDVEEWTTWLPTTRSSMPTFIFIKQGEEADGRRVQVRRIVTVTGAEVTMTEVKVTMTVVEVTMTGAEVTVTGVEVTVTGVGVTVTRVEVTVTRVEAMAKEHTDVVFLKVDVEELDDLAADYEINCMPTFIFIKQGEKVTSFSGANADRLLELVTQHK